MIISYLNKILSTFMAAYGPAVIRFVFLAHFSILFCLWNIGSEPIRYFFLVTRVRFLFFVCYRCCLLKAKIRNVACFSSIVKISSLKKKKKLKTWLFSCALLWMSELLTALSFFYIYFSACKKKNYETYVFSLEDRFLRSGK